MDEIAGTLEYVRLRATCMRELGGKHMVFSNSVLLKIKIRNCKPMRTRRVVFDVGVTSEVDLPSLEATPAIIKEALSAQPQASFDRAHFTLIRHAPCGSCVVRRCCGLPRRCRSGGVSGWGLQARFPSEVFMVLSVVH